jgi:hypothetical protein
MGCSNIKPRSTLSKGIALTSLVSSSSDHSIEALCYPALDSSHLPHDQVISSDALPSRVPSQETAEASYFSGNIRQYTCILRFPWRTDRRLDSIRRSSVVLYLQCCRIADNHLAQYCSKRVQCAQRLLSLGTSLRRAFSYPASASKEDWGWSHFHDRCSVSRSRLLVGFGMLTIRSACASSILTLIYRIKLIDNEDTTWNLAPVFTLSIVETTVGIMCSCMPALASFFRLHTPIFHSILSLFGSTFKRTQTSHNKKESSSSFDSEQRAESRMVTPQPGWPLDTKTITTFTTGSGKPPRLQLRDISDEETTLGG